MKRRPAMLVIDDHADFAATISQVFRRWAGRQKIYMLQVRHGTPLFNSTLENNHEALVTVKLDCVYDEPTRPSS